MKYRIIASILLLLILGAGWFMFGRDTNQSSSPAQAIPGRSAPSFLGK